VLYGAAANKLKKMLGLTDKEAEEMYDAYWDALPALRDLKNKVEKYWEANGQQYVLAMDGRRLMARSKHSLLNLLFQSAGSLAMKYGIILTAQKLELENSLGNLLNDTHEENITKVNQMIIYHK
jgi:DNA polymerase I-like protein with 3'-5' exonuclease and polymerase domains